MPATTGRHPSLLLASTISLWIGLMSPSSKTSMTFTFSLYHICLTIVVLKLRRLLFVGFLFCSNTIIFFVFDGSIESRFFMLANVNSYHDGVLANYSHENIGDIRKMWLYSIASSNLFETDFQSLFGYYTCKYFGSWTDYLHCIFYST